MITGVAVEKLACEKSSKIITRQAAPQTIFCGHLDIFYPPISGYLEKKGLFQQPADLSTLTLFGSDYPSTFKHHYDLASSALASLRRSHTRLKRRYGRGHLHFITCSYYRRRPLLRTARSRDVFLKILAEVRARYCFGLVARPGEWPWSSFEFYVGRESRIGFDRVDGIIGVCSSRSNAGKNRKARQDQKPPPHRSQNRRKVKTSPPLSAVADKGGAP